MLKTRITKRQLAKITTVLAEKIFERCPMRNSAATLEIISRELVNLQREMSLKEGNTAWMIPMEVSFGEDNNLLLSPDMSSVLILDFDS